MPPEQTAKGPQPRIVDLFAGPGGLDVGAAWLGIPVTGIELDANACKTRSAAGLETIQDDVRAHGPSNFRDSTVLAGGPPCQTFTVAGAGSGRRALDAVIRRVAELENSRDAESAPNEFADERTGLVFEPMRWALLALRASRPFSAIVLEQVPAVLPIWEAFGDVLERNGYGVAHGILRSEEFGVPQTRRRAILIARLDDRNVKLPTPTHQRFRKSVAAQGAFELPELQPCVSMAVALSRKTKFTVVSNYGSGGDPRNRGQRHSDEPSATVTGKIMRNRLRLADGVEGRLSHHEAGVLQTFPPDFPWRGSDIGQQIGNAIPPRLAVHVLAQALKISFDGSELDHAVNASWTNPQQARMPVDFEAAMVGTSD